MLIVWPVLFGILAIVFGVLGFTGEAHGWTEAAKVLFSVFALGFGMALIIGQMVVKKLD